MRIAGLVLLSFLATAGLAAADQQIDGGTNAGSVIIDPAFDGLSAMPGTPGYVNTPLGQLHYWTYGEGTPLVLLHQAPLFSIEFAHVLPLLAERGMKAIAVDLPGFGFSQRPAEPASGADYGTALSALLDHLNLETTSVAGSLTGSTVALAWALHDPDRLSCLMLQSLPVYSPEELDARVKAPPPDTRLYGDGRHIFDWWMGMTDRRTHLAQAPETLQWLMISTLLSGDFNWYGARTAETFITRTFDSAAALKQVQVPTLMISLEGNSVSSSAKRARALRPDFTYAEVSVEKGLLTYNHPARWVGLVTEFMTNNECAG